MHDRMTGYRYRYDIDYHEAMRGGEGLIVAVLELMKKKVISNRGLMMGTNWYETENSGSGPIGGSTAGDSYDVSDKRLRELRRQHDLMQMGLSKMNHFDIRKKDGIKFNRLSELINMDQGDRFAEPLDELRLKVFNWLGR